MKISNKNNFYIDCLVIKEENAQIFDMIVTKKLKKNKYFVIQKIGTVNSTNNKFQIDSFALVYWLQFDPIISSNAQEFLNQYIFGTKQWKRKKWIIKWFVKLIDIF